jgi:hypothetical protein
VIVPAVNNAALHHEDGMPQRLGVRDRVARDRDQIGIAARLDGAYLVGPTQQLGGIARGREERTFSIALGLLPRMS